MKKHISPFLKEERYAIHQNKQNEQKQFLGREPPLTLKSKRFELGEIGDKLRLQISLYNIFEELYEDLTCKICDNDDRYCGIQIFILTDFGGRSYKLTPVGLSCHFVRPVLFRTFLQNGFKGLPKFLHDSRKQHIFFFYKHNVYKHNEAQISKKLSIT